MIATEVWKLGGTSLDTPEKRTRIGDMVAAEVGKSLVVVVSAASGVTDQLLSEISAVPGTPQHLIDAYVATGELHSAALVAAAITAAGRPAEVLLPTLLFTCDDQFGDASVLRVERAPLESRLERGVVAVVPGFFGSAKDGRVCLLGRGGSDYTATLIGASLSARVVLLKNDTDGIYSADPRTNPNARRYGWLTHAQACALSHAGAKVLNGKAAKVAMSEKLTVVVRSTFGSGPGTVIAAVAEASDEPVCTSLAG